MPKVALRAAENSSMAGHTTSMPSASSKAAPAATSDTQPVKRPNDMNVSDLRNYLLGPPAVEKSNPQGSPALSPHAKHSGSKPPTPPVQDTPKCTPKGTPRAGSSKDTTP